LVRGLPAVVLLAAVDLHGGRLIHQGGQRREGGAQAAAAAAAVADVEDPLELLLGLRLVPELGILPVERMPRGSFERAFSHNFLLRLQPSRPARPAPSGSGSRGCARPSPASRTSRRSR